MKVTSKRLLVFALMFSMLFSLLSPVQLVAASTTKAAAPITRGEVCKLVNSLIGATTESANMNSIVNYKQTDAYYSVMSIAYNAGYIVPNKSHQLANASAKANYNFVAIILSRLLKTTRLEVLGKHDPYATLTSKTLKSFVSEVLPTVITKNVSNKTYKGNVIINTPDITLTDITINGSLVIGDGVADKEAILNNVNVTGKLVVRGGGENSIKIMGSSSISTVEIVQVNNAVSIKVSDDAEVKIININDGSDDVILYGSIGTVNVVGNNLNVSTNGATISTVNLSGKNASFSVSADTIVDTVEVKEKATEAKLNITGAISSVVASAANPSINVGGKGSVSNVTAAVAAKGISINVSANASISSISSAAPGTVISGAGKVETAKIDGSNSSISTPNTKVTVGKDATGVTTTNTNSNNNTGTTPNTDPGSNPGTDPGTNPGTDPGTNPGTDPGSNPGTDPGTNPGTDPGTNPGTTPVPNPPLLNDTYWTGHATASEVGGYSKRTVRVYVNMAIDTVSTVSGSAFTASGVSGAAITSVISGHASGSKTAYEYWMDITVIYPDGSNLNDLLVEYSPTNSCAVINSSDSTSKMDSFIVYGSFAVAPVYMNKFRIIKDPTPTIESVVVSEGGKNLKIHLTPSVDYLGKYKFTINSIEWTYINIAYDRTNCDLYVTNPNASGVENTYNISFVNTADDNLVYDAVGQGYTIIKGVVTGTKITVQ